jgi:tetratricopeptide (TPR) repeat protein
VGVSAEQLAGMPLGELLRLPYAAVSDLRREIGRASTAVQARALLGYARISEPGQRLAERSAALDLVLSSAADASLHAEALAERAIDLARANRLDDAEQLAHDLLHSTTSEVAAGRATEALARAAAWRGDDPAARQAQRLFAECVDRYAALDADEWRGHAMFWLGNAVHLRWGRLDQARHDMAAGIRLLAPQSPRRGSALTFLADLLTTLGEVDEAVRLLDEADLLAAEHSDPQTQAYAHWSRARLASLTGDIETTVRQIRNVEAAAGDWFSITTGATFLADAAELLDRVGQRSAAADYLRRATARDPADEFVRAATAVITARHGDPRRGFDLLVGLAREPWLEPWQAWRRNLFSAWALLRLGAPDAAAYAVRAFEQAESLHGIDLALRGERELGSALLPIAARSGCRVAQDALVGRGGLVVSLLGELAVSRDGEPVEVPTGTPGKLFRLLALHHPSGLTPEQAIDALWPDRSGERGDKALRDALSRLRSRCGPVVIREPGRLRLQSAWVDAAAFERTAERALAATGEAAVSQAVAAHALWSGPLLPADLYDDWCADHRRRFTVLHERIRALLSIDT